MRTRDGLEMDWTRSGRTTGGLQQDSMSIGGLHVDSHRIPGGVKYTVCLPYGMLSSLPAIIAGEFWAPVKFLIK